MSRLLAVAARELRERWLLFPGAFVAGCFPLVLPAFGVSRAAVPTVGVTGAVLLGAAAAIVIGSSMLARDAADGRLGFLFSRPLHWGTIWGGKWLAAIALATASAFLYAIPWMAAYPLSSLGGRHGDSWLQLMLDGPGTVLGFMAVVLTVGLANLGATLFRSRSPWLAADLVLMLAATWVTWRHVAPLWYYGVLGSGPSTLLLVVLPLALGLLVGSALQVAVGRTDLHRAHRWLSVGFWAVTACTLAGAAGYWQWVRATGPDGVNVHSVSRDTAGRWIYVEGNGRRSGSYPHAFLIDTTNGRYLARPEPGDGLDRIGFGMLFSADGRFGATLRALRGGAGLTLFDLRETQPRVRQVALESSPPPTWKTGFALSPSAASVFVAHETGASLFELPSGRRIATATIPPGWRPAAARYLAEGAARAWLVPSEDGPARRTRAEMRVVDLSADGTSSAATFPVAAAVDPVLGWRQVLPDARGERIVTSEAGLQLREGASGALLASLVEGTGTIPPLFFADGRILVEGRAAAGQPDYAHPRLWIFDRVGTKLADFELPLQSPGSLHIGPELAPGRVVVSCHRAGCSWRTPWWSTWRAVGSSRSSPGFGPCSASPWAPGPRPPGWRRASNSSMSTRGGAWLSRSVASTVWSGSTLRPASGRSWLGRARHAASGSARAERLEHHVEGAPRSLGEQRRERLRLEAERGLERRTQPRSVSRHEDRRAHAAAQHEVRGREAGDAAVRVVERQDLDEPRERHGGRLIGREIARAGDLQPLGERRQAAREVLDRGGRAAVPLALDAAQAHRSREGLVPRADRRDAERRLGGHGRAGTAQRHHLRRPAAHEARGADLVPAEAQARELEAPEQLRILDDPGEP